MSNCNERVLPYTVEGKTYESNKQYITGAEIKKVSNTPLETEIYLSVMEPWKDELIKNDDKVDLARPDIEHFYVKKPLKFFIGCKEFEWPKQYIKGSEIRKLGEIEAGFEIFLAIKGPWEDEKIEDNDRVDLAREGIEKFYSCKPNTNNG